MPEQILFARYRLGPRGPDWCVVYYGDPATPRVVTDADGHGIYYTSGEEAQQVADDYTTGMCTAWISIAGHVVEAQREQAQQELEA